MHPLLPILQKEKERRQLEKSFLAFAQAAWPIIEPGVPFVHGWHLDVLCEHLENVTLRNIRRLLINVPPRTAKSTFVSVLWPCWEWTTVPNEKYLCASYSSLLTIRDNLKARRLLTSEWYKDFWGEKVKLTGDQNQKTRFENTETGYRLATSVGGTATGEGGSRIIIDDPHSATDAQSDQVRNAAIEWFSQTMSTRLNTPKKDAVVVVMQRLHEDDVSGYILRQGGYEHLCLPMEWDGEKRTTILGAYDKREVVGELLCPDRFGDEEVNRLKVNLGTYGSAGQLQQQPAPTGGGLIKVDHFNIWPIGRSFPKITHIVQSYDTAFTEKTDGDPTACAVFGIYENDKGCKNVLLLDAWTKHLSYPDLRKTVADSWGKTYAGGSYPDVVLIEEKGSGQSLIQDLRRTGISIRAYNPGRADKLSRLHRIAPLLEAGILSVPRSNSGTGYAAWANELIMQATKFPVASHDDLVDALTQAMIYLQDGGFLRLKEDFEEKKSPYLKKELYNPYMV